MNLQNFGDVSEKLKLSFAGFKNYENHTNMFEVLNKRILIQRSDVMQFYLPCIATDISIITRRVPVFGTKHMKTTYENSSSFDFVPSREIADLPVYFQN